MNNHIEAKFLGFRYTPVSQESFARTLPTLTDALRDKLPRFDTPTLNGVRFNISSNAIATQQEEQSQELHMVDAKGLWGVKIGNTGLSISASSYISHEDLRAYANSIIEPVVETLKVTHFSRTTLRNINLFEEDPTKPNQFIDIENCHYWGRQDFKTLKNNFLCQGAATRHEYFSNNHEKHIQVTSGVVMEKQSYIPQEEWDIWRLRGEIPSANRTQLLVDITCNGFEAPMNNPKKQNNVTEYTWEKAEQRLDELHVILNNVYSDITTD